MSLDSLFDALDAFSSCTGIPVTVYGSDGNVTREFLSDKKICTLLPHYSQGAECKKDLRFSMDQSFDLGEPYIFSCASGLVQIAVPLLFNKTREGCVVAGPVVLGNVSESLISRILELNPNDPVLLTRITFFLRDLRDYSPEQVQKIATLLYGAVLSCHHNWEEYEEICSRQRSQVRGGEAIQKYKQDTSLLQKEHGGDLEARLVRELQGKNRAAAEETMKAILEEPILVEGGNFDIIRMRLFELFVFLCQAAMEGGVSLQKIFGVGFDPIEGLNNAGTVDELEAWLKQILGHFSNQVFTAARPGYSELITQATRYLEEQYSQKLTLRELARHLHINESYLSKLFKKELGMNFTDYLNELRINKSIQLIEETSMSLLEIAIHIGFEDQSYYTKIFKKVTGRTPRQYRAEQAGQARFRSGGGRAAASELLDNEYIQAFRTGGARR